MIIGHKGNLKFIFWNGASSLALLTNSSLCWQKVLPKTKNLTITLYFENSLFSPSTAKWNPAPYMACWALPSWSTDCLSSLPFLEALSTCSSYLLLVSTAPCGTTGLRPTSSCPHLAEPSEITSSVKFTTPTPKEHPWGNCLSSDNTPLLTPDESIRSSSRAGICAPFSPVCPSPQSPPHSACKCFLNVSLVKADDRVEECLGEGRRQVWRREGSELRRVSCVREPTVWVQSCKSVEREGTGLTNNKKPAE